MPSCKPPKKSAEEMLKKALEFANQGMDEHRDTECDYLEGMYCAYEDMVSHLEMLIKEVKNA